MQPECVIATGFVEAWIDREHNGWINVGFAHTEITAAQEELSELLGVSWGTVARWEGGQTPDAMSRARVERLWRIIGLLEETMAPAHRLSFLEQRHPLLLRMRPIDLLATQEGFEALVALLEGAATGAFA